MSAVRIDLRGARLRRADLRGVNFLQADLEGADLTAANLIGADLRSANLSRARLGDEVELNWAVRSPGGSPKVQQRWATDLSAANLYGAILEGADVRGADMRGAVLFDASLRDAIMERVNLSGADLRNADLTNTDFLQADMDGAIYEPKAGTVPRLDLIVRASHLETLRYEDLPQGLVNLRDAFRREGFRRQERQVTYAIKKCERKKANWLEQAFMWSLFEVTCRYGLAPWRPILIIGALLGVFSAVYLFALCLGRGGGIYLVEGDELVGSPHESPRRLRYWCWAFYFSLITAFNIGWRELNVGNWITRIQKSPFRLVPTGWVRSVAGVQALLSVYLLALWALTYFGRPFE
jgi:hypothetical protein